ncbi:hypothetical protein Vadar_028147 [Vaccinium darrowii]|uniref:Uncharacterized protein n=1 Tax=Vaccinium darrowii TaxID=229202 RepID=A0ACB7ZEX2_9ERIC|nr:hypothetical protein Vadar_028147 [Vaccinium darrowii]
MQAVAALMRRQRVSGASYRTLGVSWPAEQFHSGFSTFCTLAPDESSGKERENLNRDEGGEEEPKSLCGRIERLPRGAAVGSAFQSWMGDGFPIHRGNIFHTINRLRKLHFNKRALQTMMVPPLFRIFACCDLSRHIMSRFVVVETQANPSQFAIDLLSAALDPGDVLCQEEL